MKKVDIYSERYDTTKEQTDWVRIDLKKTERVRFIYSFRFYPYNTKG